MQKGQAELSGGWSVDEAFPADACRFVLGLEPHPQPDGNVGVPDLVGLLTYPRQK